jgi:hypothetical protein
MSITIIYIFPSIVPKEHQHKLDDGHDVKFHSRLRNPFHVSSDSFHIINGGVTMASHYVSNYRRGFKPCLVKALNIHKNPF